MEIRSQVLAKRRGYTLIEFLVVLGIVAILAALLSPVFNRSGHGYSPRLNCRTNLQQIFLGFRMYADDNGRLPPIAMRSAYYGWAAALRSYVRTPDAYQCPSEEEANGKKKPGFLSLGYRVRPDSEEKKPRERGYTDYWMNARLSRVELKDIAEPARTILSGDGNDGRDSTDARYSLGSLPAAWLQNESSPARRHINSMNLLFTDGHVKASPAESLASKRPGAPSWTFAR